MLFTAASLEFYFRSSHHHNKKSHGGGKDPKKLSAIDQCNVVVIVTPLPAVGEAVVTGFGWWWLYLSSKWWWWDCCFLPQYLYINTGYRRKGSCRLEEQGSITPPGKALRYCTKAQQRLCSKQAINRAIMHHVPEHSHSHLPILLSPPAVEGNWIIQLFRIGNIFHSEQYVVGEHWPQAFFGSHPVPAMLLQSDTTQFKSWFLVPFCMLVVMLTMLHLSDCTQKPYASICVCISYQILHLLLQGLRASACVCRYRCSLSVIEDDEELVHIGGYCSWPLINQRDRFWELMIAVAE